MGLIFAVLVTMEELQNNSGLILSTYILVCEESCHIRYDILKNIPSPPSLGVMIYIILASCMCQKFPVGEMVEFFLNDSI